MSSESYLHPNTELPHPIKISQIYSDSRTGDLTKIIYLDQDVALLRDKDGHHRLQRRRDVRENVISGRLSIEPDVEDFGYTGPLEDIIKRMDELESLGGRKNKHYAEAFRDAIDILTDHTQPGKPVDFEDVPGIGESTAKNLRDDGIETTRDVRRASDEELLGVPGMGSSNLGELRAYIDA